MRELIQGTTLALAVLLAGCANDGNLILDGDGNTITTASAADQTGSINGASSRMVAGLPEGYHCPLVPNGFDPVGSIYRVDNKKTYFRVADLSNDPRILQNIKKRAISDYAFNHKESASADVSVSLLKRILPGFSGNANTKKQFNIDITVKKMHGKLLLDSEADYIRDWFAEKIKVRPGNRYFLVREGIFAGSVSYVVDSQDLAKAGVKAKVEEVIDTTANATFKDQGKKLVITQTLDPPTQICVKVAEIEVGGGANGVATAKLKPSAQTSAPEIRRIAN